MSEKEKKTDFVTDNEKFLKEQFKLAPVGLTNLKKNWCSFFPIELQKQ